MMLNKLSKPGTFLFVDGIMITGQSLYSSQGQEYKDFSPDDADAPILLKDKFQIHFVIADERGFEITKKNALSITWDILWIL